VIRCTVSLVLYLVLVCGLSLPCAAQTPADLQGYFKQSIGLSPDQIADIRDGKAVTKVLKSRTPAEIFVFGAVYINTSPESYIQLASDFDRLRKLPGYLAIGRFSDPPRATDLDDGFSFDSEDIKALKDCKPGDCDVQIPAQAMKDIHQAIDWEAPDLDRQVNQLLHQRAIERLQAYQREGNQALGAYHDKEHPTDVPKEFEEMLSYARALPKYLPDFNRYLLDYPAAKPANVENTFYWSKVKFGLKPTLRMVHIVTMRGRAPNEPACAIAEKQLYSSHYFQTALDLTFCIRGSDDANKPGFYLIKAMGSEQAGLTGFKGSIIRKKAVGGTASSLQKSLEAIKKTLEQKQ